MKRSMIRLWISLVILLSLVALPVVAYAQETPPDPDPVGEPGEPGELGEPGEGGEGGEAPEYLPVTGGSTQAATSMVVLAVLGLLFAGTFATRALQHGG